ncbi:copper chaperone PCu(A)C [Hydrogenophaga sp.]|uniref:copper chaperone PCu(A)C n=1 Tax=Hydrogenophaga sp. TaxID=1904254 RepID=UPI00260BA479|nr:copper chaperone PCu(A)C [Hydrogenophaga sp.]
MTCVSLTFTGGAMAHGFKAGDLRIDHPYATPTGPGMRTGAVYLRGIQNLGRQGDRLVGASTPRAGHVEIQQVRLEGDIARMHSLPALELPAGETVALRHNAADGAHLMLLDLTQPLEDGQRFPITLRFERAGEREVIVWVQTPRARGAAANPGAHAH